MINFILYKDDSYPFGNSEILQFMLSKPADKVKKFINKLPQKIVALGNSLLKTKRMTII